MRSGFWKKRIRAFRCAGRGLCILFRSETHARIHALAAAVVIAAGLWLRVSAGEWLALILCIGLVLAMEAVNTAFERLTDLISPDFHPLAGEAKDLAAGAVLWAAAIAAIVGGIVFLPKLSAIFAP